MKDKQNIIFFLFILFWSLGQYVQAQNEKDSSGIIFPRPFAIAIDDLGWNIGNNDGADGEQGPYRIGLNRQMHLGDYKCIVEVAKAMNIRLQGVFILCEMDRENVLRNYPTTTRAGSNWDNSKNINQEQLEIMNYVKEQAAYLEFGLHGVGHEFWPEQEKRKRAEWYNTDDNEAWPQNEIANHIEAFKKILAQYHLSPKEGHSFPESFVPCAYSYHWNPNGDYSSGSMLAPEGVKYANTLFAEVKELNPPTEANGGGIDHGVLVLNRINYGNFWYQLSSVPTVSIDQQESDIIETHWSNWLAQDDFLQEETNKKWTNYFSMVQQQRDRYLAKNTEQFYSQWLYKKYTTIKEKTVGQVAIDNTGMPPEIYDYKLLSTLVLKVKLAEGQHISKAMINGKAIASYYENAGFGFIELPPLKAKKYQLNYEISKETLAVYIHHLGTSIIYHTMNRPHSFEFKTRIYGKQIIEIHGLEKPEDIYIDNNDVKLIHSDYQTDNKVLQLEVQAHDIQGETASFIVKTN